MRNGTDIALHLAQAKLRIEQACQRVGRKADEITLVAVTKTVAADKIQKAYEAGVRIFGENKSQELLLKVNALPQDIQWHFIGHLQTNKVKSVLEPVQMIQSLDRFNLALELEKQLAKTKKKKDVLIEVNTSGESTKYGFKSGEVLEAVDEISKQCPHLNVKGLMTIGPNTKEVSQVRSAFKMLAQLYKECQKHFNQYPWSVLSMGMSDDFEIAIEEGSTMVRLGTALFGQRKIEK
jgi:pyridoxal phosphate enzyme (YggS family)